MDKLTHWGPNPWLSPELQPKRNKPIDIGDGPARLAPGAHYHNPWVSDEAAAKARSEVKPGGSPSWLEKGVGWAAEKAGGIDPIELFGGLFD